MTPKRSDKPKGKTPLVAFRFPLELTKQLDDYAKKLEAERPGQLVSRSDAVRIALHRFFEAEKHAGRK